jgi:hypothetical protein
MPRFRRNYINLSVNTRLECSTITMSLHWRRLYGLCPSGLTKQWVHSDQSEAGRWYRGFIWGPPVQTWWFSLWYCQVSHLHFDWPAGSLSTQEDPLACSVGIWVPTPFHICCGLLFQCAQANHVHWGQETGMSSPTQQSPILYLSQGWDKASNSHFSSKRGPTSVSSTFRWSVFL